MIFCKRSVILNAMLPMTVSILAAAPAWADCTWMELVTDEARAATVQSASPRAHFHKGGRTDPGCPEAEARCQDRAYVTQGDVVLVGPTHGPYTCAGFSGPNGVTTIGWLLSASLSPLPESERMLSDWIGQWVGDQRITISAGRDGTVVVKGQATGGRDHVGEVAGEARPVGNLLAFTMTEDLTKTLPYDAGEDVDCRVRLWRRGPYMLARDNGECGGVDVTFSGFYRRDR